MQIPIPHVTVLSQRLRGWDSAMGSVLVLPSASDSWKLSAGLSNHSVSTHPRETNKIFFWDAKGLDHLINRGRSSGEDSLEGKRVIMITF